VRHGFSEGEWLALMDADLPERSSTALMRHVAHCEECAELLECARRWERKLARELEQISDALGPSEERLEELLAKALARVAEQRPARWQREESAQLAIATALLRQILEPLLGVRTTNEVMDLAALHSSSSAQPEIRPETWPLFIRRLGSSVGNLCGSNTERLVGCIGRSAGLEIQ